jgi:hypothetical protein
MMYFSFYFAFAIASIHGAAARPGRTGYPPTLGVSAAVFSRV